MLKRMLCLQSGLDVWRCITRCCIAISVAIAVVANIHASNPEVSAEEFIAASFSPSVPVVGKLWLDKEQKKQLAVILGHNYPGLRVRYWGADQRTAWILDEIGKERPITIGVVVENHKIREVTVLAFRESRGGEVRYPFFTRQFQGVAIDEQQSLDKSINGITGATLSVQAVTRVARAALYLHELTPYAKDPVIQTPPVSP